MPGKLPGRALRYNCIDLQQKTTGMLEGEGGRLLWRVREEGDWGEVVPSRVRRGSVCVWLQARDLRFVCYWPVAARSRARL